MKEQQSNQWSVPTPCTVVFIAKLLILEALPATNQKVACSSHAGPTIMPNELYPTRACLSVI